MLVILISRYKVGAMISKRRNEAIELCRGVAAISMILGHSFIK